MRPAYLLLVSSGGTLPVEAIASRTALEPVLAAPPIAVLATAHYRCVPLGEGGCVIGTLFDRAEPCRPLARLQPGRAARAEASLGLSLLGECWGSYVAALPSGSGFRVLRDPSATCPCYFAGRGGILCFASDARLLAECGFAGARVQWEELARDFFDARVPRPATCLEGISELLAGHLVEAREPALDQRHCWDPWEFTSPATLGSDEAARDLAATIRRCVSAQGAAVPGRGKLLLSVSGGLDSSIVAACLAKGGADLACLTMYGEDGGSDERSFARALCDRLGLELIERPYRLDQVDIGRPLGSHLPRPRDRSHALAYELAHAEVAGAIGARAFVTGNGGDSVFGYSQSAAPVADRWLSEGFSLRLLDALLDVCRQTGCGMFEALAASWKALRAPRGYRCRPNPLFLARELVAELEQRRPAHCWLEAPPGVPPGKAAHVASILGVQQAMEPARGELLPVLNPLMSQPVIEACLAIPSWEWRLDGRDRALARRGFARDLPAAVLDRRVKGSPAFFAGQVLERYRKGIRERLLDGRMAAHRLVDRDALEAALCADHLCSDEERVRILQFSAAEAWLDAWASTPRMTQEADC